MASPRRIYRIYHCLAKSAGQVAAVVAAKGEKPSGTVTELIAKDRERLLTRWGEEMAELCGVLDGTHNDSYLMESTQTFYWGSLFAVTGGLDWDQLRFDVVRRQASTCGIDTIPELRTSVARLVAMGTARAKPEKCFLLWNVADWIYRDKTKPESQWSLEQLMEAELQEMKKRAYLEPILREIVD